MLREVKQVGERERYNEVSEMLDTQNYLLLVRRRGEAGLELSRVYRNMRRKELFLLAYSNLYANQGATTPGIALKIQMMGCHLKGLTRLLTNLPTGHIRGLLSDERTLRKSTHRRCVRLEFR